MCTDVLTPLGALISPSVSDDLNYFLIPPGTEGCGGGAKCSVDRPLCLEGRCINPSCAALKRFCGDPTLLGIRTRQVCSETCGCSDPRSSLALSLPESGCGGECTSRPAYQAALAEMPCEDLPKDSPTFTQFLDQFDHIRGVWPKGWADYAQLFASAWRRFGCSHLNMSLTEARSLGVPHPEAHGSTYLFPCVERGTYWPSKAMSYFCPVACGCKSGRAAAGTVCPAKCTPVSAAP